MVFPIYLRDLIKVPGDIEQSNQHPTACNAFITFFINKRNGLLKLTLIQRQVPKIFSQ